MIIFQTNLNNDYLTKPKFKDSIEEFNEKITSLNNNDFKNYFFHITS